MRVVLWLFLAALCGSAGAAEWTLVHSGQDGEQYFYDASKLAFSGNEITYWKKVLFKTPQPYKGQLAVSALYRERIHCAEHTVRPLLHIVNGAGGAVIEHVATEGETTPVIPETIGDLFESALCPQVKAWRDEEARKTPPPPAPEPAEIPPGTL